jgi:cell division protein ZapD
LLAWLRPLLPIRDGLIIVLRLLRASGRPEAQTARNGAYQLMMGGGSSQMVRVALGDDETVVPEISANKYALNIRFVSAESAGKPRPCERDIDFQMTFCNL